MWIRLAIIFITSVSFSDISIGPGMRVMEEICNNALDDDEDGLIDMNDPDCDCPVLEPLSLIPNPSFEEHNCCPSGNAQLDCAETWIQASEATTDYYHKCGYFGRSEFPVPIPIPDGEAYIGFRNGRFGTNGTNANWKEYTGACLSSPLQAGVKYTFQFYIGFTNFDSSPPMDVVFYGSADCENLPFGVGDRTFGCPTNGEGWIVLGKVRVQGFNSWKQYEITVTPDKDMKAMAIGPDCFELSRTSNTYYFLDNLILADTESFKEKVTATSHPCDPSYSLRIPPLEGAHYQWYKDGIAILGATAPDFIINAVEGNYQVLVTTDLECRLSPAFPVQIPDYETSFETTICPGESYELAGELFSKPGQHSVLLKNSNDCDSLVTLALNIQSDIPDTFRTLLFQGETLSIGPYSFNAKTEELLELRSTIGCDSLIYLILDLYDVYIPNAFSPNGDGINDEFIVFDNEELVTVNSIQIYDRWGSLVFFQSDGEALFWDGRYQNDESETGVYVYMIEVLLHDGERKMLAGDVTLLR